MSTIRRALGRGVGVVRGASGLVGARLRARGAIVLTYHDVTEDPAITSEQVSPAALRADLAAATDWGLRFVGLDELVTRFSAGETLDGLVAITFDDAFVGIQRHALGILAEAGITATVFAVSRQLGMMNPEWYPGTDRLMTAHQLREVADAGHAVHSHTRTHADLPTLDDPGALQGELAGARADLEEILGRPVEYLAYPFGHFDRRVRTAAQATGYRAAFTFLAGRVVPGIDRYRLPRFPMGSRHHRARLAYLLARPSSSFRDFQPETVTA